MDAQSETRMPGRLPVLPLRGMVAFPGILMPLVLTRPEAIRQAEQAARGDGWLALAAVRDSDAHESGQEAVYDVAVAARLEQAWRGEDGNFHAVVRGLARARLSRFGTAAEGGLWADASVLAPADDAPPGPEEQALLGRITASFIELGHLNPQLPPELVATLASSELDLELVFMLVTALRLPVSWRQALLEAESRRGQLELAVLRLAEEVALAQLGLDLQRKLDERMQRTSREAMLREQLGTIQRELEPDGDPMLARLEAKLAAGLLPEEAETEARRELRRLAQIPMGSPEQGMVRQYLEWLDRMPWGVRKEQLPSLAAARKALASEHAGLERVKERLLEHVAVKRLRHDRHLPADDARAREPVLCLVGPPGVGKTSLAKSVAKALGRPFVRISLGGVHDEAAVRGHRRSYIGALPGRIAQALARCGASDPLILLDELDKLGAGPHGDPAAALLELLDPEQNQAFKDHYLDVPFDLSRAVFMATANTLDGVPAALRDRLEVLTLGGYTEEEKLAIARTHLLPRQRAAHGLRARELALDEGLLRQIINSHTREAGVRELERAIATLARKAATQLASNRPAPRFHPGELRRHLGPPVHPRDLAERLERPGVATGLVWTPVGGEILFVEALALPGKPQLRLTGQLGEVMRESAEAALSYVRSRAERLGLDPAAFERLDFHIHVPGGAIPKDGPSAGVTLATALVSALTGRLVREDVGMTGELSLRGRVLPVGGIPEKVLGAKLAGLRTIILPRANLADLDELEPELREGLCFIPVDTVDEVWEAAFAEARQVRRAA